MLARETYSCLIPKAYKSTDKVSFRAVYINIWGPSRVESTLGFRYFVTFIDDYSRCT